MLHVQRPILFVLAFLLGVTSKSQSQSKWMMDNSPRRPLLQAVTGLPAPRFVTQPQDHFDSSNKNLWQQAYYVNDTFFVPGGDAPVFLCVGGEGPPIDGSAVVNSVHCNVAVEWLREKKALMFALEHRYYGCHSMSACPVTDFNNETRSLKYLSSRQAIEDIANFIRQANQDHGLTKANRWVTFGGSYPGMLAGWSRLHHPELIHASVASSAPVHAKLDMFEYNDALAHAYTVSDNNVGGSEKCRAAIREGHRQLEVMLESSEGIADAEALLTLPKGGLATRQQQLDELGEGIAYFPAQGNDPACKEEACNIKKICELMLVGPSGDELNRLVTVRRLQRSQPLSSPATQPLPNFWFYQTCMEFGFYQTCMKGSSCMFPQITDVESMAAGCEAYGVKIPDIARHIEATNKHYGGLTPLAPSGSLGSCVLWPNGEVDPWATLSILKSPGPEQPVIWVEGASHHAWTHPTATTDQLSVIQARTLIRPDRKSVV